MANTAVQPNEEVSSDALVGKRFRSRARRRAALAAGSTILVGLAATSLCASAGARAAAAPTPVRVTITNSRIVFAPSYAPTGPLEFTVVNRTRGARDFGVGAQRTKAIAPGHSARLAATLQGNGDQTFSSVATAGPSNASVGSHSLTGALYLFEPCGSPATTTVDVSLTKSGPVLSQTSVPCGTVQFVVTDVDAPGTSLLVALDVPPQSGATYQLDPGGTATLTVPFAAKAVVRCYAVQEDPYGDAYPVGSAASLTLS
jgi:hypothetical protein